MNKKMRELLAKIEEKNALANSYMDGENKDVVKANEIMDEVNTLKAEYDTAKRIYESEKMAGGESVTTPVPTREPSEDKQESEPVDAIAKFAQDARNGFKLDKTMNEGTGADGGYTVPEDIVTQIEEYRDAKKSLLSLVRRVVVNTNKGQRTFKKRSQQTGFTKVGEGGKIGAKGTPQFERISYEIDKYAGYFPVTNEVLEDTDANLANTLIEWIGDESRVTANKLILKAINTKDAVDLVDMDGIKKAINVTLGQAFKNTCKIVTNDDGLQYLDTLRDGNDRYLLAPMPGEVMAMTLQVGAHKIPVEVVPNGDMPTSADKIPFIVGDLNEGIVYWDRKQMNIKISDVAVIGDLNAFEEDLTLYRAIEREDVTTRDTGAFVNGYITVAGE